MKKFNYLLIFLSSIYYNLTFGLICSYFLGKYEEKPILILGNIFPSFQYNSEEFVQARDKVFSKELHQFPKFWEEFTIINGIIKENGVGIFGIEKINPKELVESYRQNDESFESLSEILLLLDKISYYSNLNDLRFGSLNIIPTDTLTGKMLRNGIFFLYLREKNIKKYRLNYKPLTIGKFFDLMEQSEKNINQIFSHDLNFLQKSFIEKTINNYKTAKDNLSNLIGKIVFSSKNTFVDLVLALKCLPEHLENSIITLLKTYCSQILRSISDLEVINYTLNELSKSQNKYLIFLVNSNHALILKDFLFLTGKLKLETFFGLNAIVRNQPEDEQLKIFDEVVTMSEKIDFSSVFAQFYLSIRTSYFFLINRIHSALNGSSSSSSSSSKISKTFSPVVGAPLNSIKPSFSSDELSSYCGLLSSCTRCKNCKKNLSENDIKRCTVCKTIYCSRLCQKDDWKVHKINCRKL